MEKVNEIERQITDCLATLEGLVTLLDAAAVYPSTDPADYQRMFGGLQILATKAEQQIEEIEFAEVFKEAPALRQQEPAPEVKTNQVEVITKTPVPTMAKKYPEIVALLKEGLPVKAIAEKTNFSVSQIYKVKSEVF